MEHFSETNRTQLYELYAGNDKKTINRILNEMCAEKDVKIFFYKHIKDDNIT
jgi:hypothetical protein